MPPGVGPGRRTQRRWPLRPGALELVVADLDGTLVDQSKVLAPSLVTAIKHLRQAGIELTMATGRTYRAALPFAVGLDINVPIITDGGSVTRDPHTSQYRRYLALTRDEALSILSAITGLEGPAYVYYDDVVYTDRMTPATETYGAALGINIVEARSLTAAVADPDRLNGPTMVVLRCQPDAVRALIQRYKGAFGQSIQVTSTMPHFLDFLPAEAGKGPALKQLCLELDIPLEAVVAIGDGRNDLDMLEVAGLGVAVGNADDEVKIRVDWVTEGCHYHGVMEVIESVLTGEG